MPLVMVTCPACCAQLTLMYSNCNNHRLGLRFILDILKIILQIPLSRPTIESLNVFLH